MATRIRACALALAGAGLATWTAAAGAVGSGEPGREGAAGVRAPAGAPAERFARGRILVKVAPGMGGPDAPGAGALLGLAEADAVLAGARAAAKEPALRRAASNPALASRLGLDRWYAVTVDPATDATALSVALRMCPGIEAAEPDGLGGPAGTNDPLFVNQWALANNGQNGLPNGLVGADIDAVRAWLNAAQAHTPTLAVIDTGVDPTHPDLGSLVIPGWNVLTGTTDTRDNGCPHGSLIAGVAAAVSNNGVGIAGVCWNARIMPVKVLHSCSGTESNCAAGIVWAADHGADVANMSLQYYGGTQVLRDALTYAAQEGVVLVCATGNFQPAGVVAWPARHPECVAVSATTNVDTIAHFSNTGPETDISAPGEEVMSAAYGGQYQYASGTSLASPQVAGAALVLRSIHPGMDRLDIFKALRDGTEDLGAPGHDPVFGAGRLNLLRAVESAAGGCYANCDHSVEPPALNAGDFACFLSRFAAADPWANCDASTVPPTLNVADFSCFLMRYAAGCGQ